MAASTSSGRCLAPNRRGRRAVDLRRCTGRGTSRRSAARPTTRSGRRISASGTSMPITRSSAWRVSPGSCPGGPPGRPSAEPVRRKPFAASGLASLSSITSATRRRPEPAPRARRSRHPADPGAILPDRRRAQVAVEMCGRPVRRRSPPPASLPTPGRPGAPALAPEPPTALIPSRAAPASSPFKKPSVVLHDELRFESAARVLATPTTIRRTSRIELTAPASGTPAATRPASDR